MEATDQILVVEDDFAIRETLIEFLEEEGYTVASAGNGQEALEYLRTAAPPCLILLDHMMPTMSGRQFLIEQQRELHFSDIPVVLLSADRSLENDADTIGAVGYLDKPIMLTDLLAIVQQYCGIPPH